MVRLLVSLLLAGYALGQQVEREVFLPDSFVGCEYPKAICVLDWMSLTKGYVAGYGTIPALISFEPVTGARTSRRAMAENTDLLLAQPDGPLVFALGRHRLTVIDGARDSLVADVEYGNGPGLAALDTAGRALIVADRLYGSLARYDYSGNRLDSIVLPLTPVALCAAPAVNRLYVAGRQDTVAVVDLSLDSVICYIGVGDEPSALAYDRVSNQLYCANRLGNSVSVIDCEADTVIGSVSVGAGPVALALHPARNRLYCADRSASRVAVVDVENLSLVDLLPVNQPIALACDPARDRLYTGSVGSELAVIDCRADTVCARLRVGEESGALALAGASALCASYRAGTLSIVRGDSVSAVVPVTTGGPRAALICQGKLYVAEEQLAQVAVLTLPGMETVSCVPVGSKPRALCRGPGTDKVYVACYGDGMVYVIDAAADTVAGQMVGGNAPYDMVLDSAGNKLYCVNFGSADLAVIDCRGDSVLSIIGFGRACRRLAYNGVSRRVYGACHDSHTIEVVDCVTDSVVAHIPTSGNPWTLAFDRTDNLVYSGTSWGGPVICGSGDTTVGDIGDAFYVKGMCWDSVANRVYLANNYSSEVLVVDGPTHAVVGRVAVSSLPADMTWCSRSGLVYLCHNRAGRVTQLVTVIEDDSVVAQLAVRPSPVGVIPDPDRSRVYVLNWESSCITVISDSPVGVAQNPRGAQGRTSAVTIVRGVLKIADSRQQTAYRAELIDVSGRKAMALHSGANDIRRLAAGIYFVRGAQAQAQAVHKVVIPR